MDGVGNAEGFRIVRLINREGPDAAGGETACAEAWSTESYWKKCKTPHTIGPAFIHPPNFSGPDSVLGTGPLRGGRPDPAKGSHSQGRETDDYYDALGRREGRAGKGREGSLEEDV